MDSSACWDFTSHLAIVRGMSVSGFKVKLMFVRTASYYVTNVALIMFLICR